VPPTVDQEVIETAFRRDVVNGSPEFFTGLLVENPDLPIAPAANREVPQQKLRYNVLVIIWHLMPS
jgi:hypothetical protein